MEGIVVYSYNPQTYVLEGAVVAPPNPEEPGKYLIHANSTEIEPPTVKNNQVAVFDIAAQAWKAVSDYRGKTYYDTASKEKQTIKDVGIEPDAAWTELEPTDPEHVWSDGVWVVPFEVLRKRKKNAISAARYEAETAGITVNGVFIATDDRSQNKISGAAIQALIDPEYTLEWKINDNSSVDLTAQELLAIATAVRVHVQNCFSKEISLLATANSCETEEELNAIQW